MGSLSLTVREITQLTCFCSSASSPRPWPPPRCTILTMGCTKAIKDTTLATPCLVTLATLLLATLNAYSATPELSELSELSELPVLSLPVVKSSSLEPSSRSTENSKEIPRRQFHGSSRETSRSSKTDCSTSSPAARLSSKLTSRAPETSRGRTSWSNWELEPLVPQLSLLTML